MQLAIIILSIFISSFIILALLFSRNLDINKLSCRVERINKSFGLKNKEQEFYKDLKLLIEHENGIKIFTIKLRSTENIFLFRIIIATSFFVFLNVLGLIFSINLLLSSLLGGAIISILPMVIIKGRLDKKQKAVLAELPDSIGIISSLIKAGLTLDESIDYLSKNYKGEICRLFHLFKIKKLEGYTRHESFDIIGRLSFCHDFKILLKVLEQSESIGNPIAKVLDNLSKSLRNNQRDQLKIRAEKIESNLILVIFIFLFIPMLMLFLLPVFPQIKLIF